MFRITPTRNYRGTRRSEWYMSGRTPSDAVTNSHVWVRCATSRYTAVTCLPFGADSVIGSCSFFQLGKILSTACLLPWWNCAWIWAWCRLCRWLRRAATIARCVYFYLFLSGARGLPVKRHRKPNPFVPVKPLVSWCRQRWTICGILAPVMFQRHREWLLWCRRRRFSLA